MTSWGPQSARTGVRSAAGVTADPTLGTQGSHPGCDQIHSVLQTTPSPLREQLRALRLPELIKHARRFRCIAATNPTNPLTAARLALRRLADRWTALDAEIGRLDQQLAHLVRSLASPLLAPRGVGIDMAGALMVAAGDNSERLSSEAFFAALCGVSPVDASSGRQH
ncbi:MAG: transposase [Chloroflexota bacterium]